MKTTRILCCVTMLLAIGVSLDAKPPEIGKFKTGAKAPGKMSLFVILCNNTTADTELTPSQQSELTNVTTSDASIAEITNVDGSAGGKITITAGDPGVATITVDVSVTDSYGNQSKGTVTIYVQVVDCDEHHKPNKPPASYLAVKDFPQPVQPGTGGPEKATPSPSPSVSPKPNGAGKGGGASSPQAGGGKSATPKPSSSPKTSKATPTPTPKTATTPKTGKRTASAFGQETEDEDAELLGVVLPEDSRPGDTVTGSVVMNPKKYEDSPGLRVVETSVQKSTLTDTTTSETSDTTLEGVVIDTGNGQPQPADKPFSVKIPEDSKTIPLTVSKKTDGSTLVKQDIPLTTGSTGSTGETGQDSHTGETAASTAFKIAPLLLDTGLQVIDGPLSGDGGKTAVQVDGQPATVVAESPRSVYWQPPKGIKPGAHTVTLQDGQTHVSFPVSVMHLGLSAPKTTMTKGEGTTFTATLSGPETLPASAWAKSGVPSDTVDVAKLSKTAGFTPPKENEKGSILLRVENASPDTVSMAHATGGAQVIKLEQSSFSKGAYVYHGTLHAQKSGGFKIVAQAVSFLHTISADTTGGAQPVNDWLTSGSSSATPPPATTEKVENPDGSTTTTSTSSSTDKDGNKTTTTTKKTVDKDSKTTTTTTTTDAQGNSTTVTNTTNPDGTSSTTTPKGTYKTTPNPDGTTGIEWTLPDGTGGGTSLPKGATVNPNSSDPNNPLPFTTTPPTAGANPPPPQPQTPPAPGEVQP